jgi:WD40 repeat protein
MALDMESPRCLALSPVTKALAVIDTEGVKTFRARTLAEVGSYRGRIFVFHPREKHAYLSEEEGVISTIDLADNKTLFMSIKHHTISCVTLVSQRGMAAVGLSDRVVIWDIESRKRLKTHSLNPFGEASSIVPDPSGSRLYCSTQYGFKSVNLDTLELEKEVKVIKIELEGQAKGNVAFSSCGRKFAYAAFGRIAVFPVSSHSPEVSLDFEEGVVTSLGFFSGTDFLYTVINDYYTLLWDLKERKMIKNIYGSVIGLKGGGNEYVLHNRGQQELEIRACADHSVLRTLPMGYKASRMILGPGGAFLACTVEKTIRLWDLDREEETATLYGHSGAIVSLSFSHDGALLISNSQYEAMITNLSVYMETRVAVQGAGGRA